MSPLSLVIGCDCLVLLALAARPSFLQGRCPQQYSQGLTCSLGTRIRTPAPSLHLSAQQDEDKSPNPQSLGTLGQKGKPDTATWSIWVERLWEADRTSGNCDIPQSFNAPNPAAFLDTKDKQVKKELKETTQFAIATKAAWYKSLAKVKERPFNKNFRILERN